jgi:hypothetical protein
MSCRAAFDVVLESAMRGVRYARCERYWADRPVGKPSPRATTLTPHYVG